MNLPKFKKPPKLTDPFSSIMTNLTWVMPAVFIPTARRIIDGNNYKDTPGLANQLYVRDLTTYSIGAATFFAVRTLAYEALSRTKLIKSDPKAYFAASLAGLGANLLYAGIGAPKLSQFLFKNKGYKKPQKSSQEAITTVETPKKLDLVVGLKNKTSFNVNFANQGPVKNYPINSLKGFHHSQKDVFNVFKNF